VDLRKWLGWVVLKLTNCLFRRFLVCCFG